MAGVFSILSFMFHERNYQIIWFKMALILLTISVDTQCLSLNFNSHIYRMGIIITSRYAWDKAHMAISPDIYKYIYLLSYYLFNPHL